MLFKQDPARERRRRALRGVASSSTMRYTGIATRARSTRRTRRRSL